MRVRVRARGKAWGQGVGAWVGAPVLSCPRRGAMASNSSKKRTHGLLAAARSKRLRTWLGLGLGLGLELG